MEHPHDQARLANRSDVRDDLGRIAFAHDHAVRRPAARAGLNGGQRVHRLAMAIERQLLGLVCKAVRPRDRRERMDDDELDTERVGCSPRDAKLCGAHGAQIEWREDAPDRGPDVMEIAWLKGCRWRDQHRHGGLSEHAIRGRAEHPLRGTREPVRAHHEEVGVLFPRALNDFRTRLPRRNLESNVCDHRLHIRKRFVEEPPQLLDRVLLDPPRTHDDVGGLPQEWIVDREQRQIAEEVLRDGSRVSKRAPGCIGEVDWAEHERARVHQTSCVVSNNAGATTVPLRRVTASRSPTGRRVCDPRASC
jgi:hypothetical protein